MEGQAASLPEEGDVELREAAGIVNADYLERLAGLLERGDLIIRPELMPGPNTERSWRTVNAYVLRAIARQMRAGTGEPISMLADTVMEGEDGKQ